MRPLISLLVVLTLLTGCVSIDYQPREEHTPDGYSDSQLENGNYLVIYESYKKSGTQRLLQDLALKRVAELMTMEETSYFMVLSSEFEEFEDTIEIPEHTIKNIYKAPSSGPSGVSTGPDIEYETVVPAYSKTFMIKKVTMEVQPLEEERDGALFVADFIGPVKSQVKSRTLF